MALTLRREEVTGHWLKLNSGLHDLYSSPNITMVIKPTWMRWEDYVEDPAIDGRIMLKWALEK